MDKDAISRCLAAHPTPWTVRRYLFTFDVVDADGGYVFGGNVENDNSALIIAAVNAFVAQRDAQITALVEAAREDFWLTSDQASQRYGSDIHQRRAANRDKLRAALAPFEQE